MSTIFTTNTQQVFNTITQLPTNMQPTLQNWQAGKGNCITTVNTTSNRVRSSFMFKLLLGVFVFLGVSASSSAQLLQWNTFGNAGTETTEPSVFNNANISSSNLTLGSGVNAAANGNRFGGAAWSSTLANAVSTNDYIEFIVSPNGGYAFSPTSLVFTWDRSNTGPADVALRSSVDGFTTDLGSITGITNAAFTSNSITISGLVNLTSATTFRLYGYNASNTSTGTGGFDQNGASPGVVNVQLNGTTCSTTTTAGTISGTSPVVVGATPTYSSDGTVGGTWSSTNPTVATVNSTTGVVTTLAPGTTDITYTVTGGCTSPLSNFKTLTVNPTPLTCSTPYNFNSQPLTLSSTQAPNTWYTDRYAPAGFAQSADLGGTLRVDINAADGETGRPPAYVSAFYNTQGRKYDLEAGTTTLKAKLYIPSAWASSNKRMAGLWGTAFDIASAISGYPILEFTSDGGIPRFRCYETGSGAWYDLGLPGGFAYDSWVDLSIRLRADGEFVYQAGNLTYTTTTGAPDASKYIGNIILQGHNNAAGVTYDIHWDDLASNTVSLVVSSPINSCGPANITAPAVTAGSVLPSGTALSYHTDAGGTITLPSPGSVSVSDTYYIKATAPGGCVSIQPIDVNVTPATVTNTNTSLSYCSIQSAIDDALTLNGHTITVAAGTYLEDVVVNKTLTITGAGYATTKVLGPIGGGGATFLIAAPGVVIDGFEITREGNNPTDWNGALNTAGVSIQSSPNSAEVRNCKIVGNRTGIDINNSNGNNIHNNIIDNNRTGMIFRNQTDNTNVQQNFITNNWTAGILFLDASGGTNVPVQSALNSTFNNNDISGNWYGEIVDRQVGGSLPTPGTTNIKNFDCNWYGAATAPVTSTANSK